MTGSAAIRAAACRWRLVVVAALAGVPGIAAAEAVPGVILRQEPSPGPGSDIGTTRIVVDGSNSRGYDAVSSTDVDIWVAVASPKGQHTKSFYKVVVSVEGASAEGKASAATRRYKLTFPYVDPLSGSVANQRTSPVARCNAALGKTNGTARAAFLRDGTRLTVKEAYKLLAVATYTETSGGGRERPGSPFRTPPRIDDIEVRTEAFADAEIECRALDRPRPRTEITTSGAPPKTGRKMEPTIKAVSLRMTPAAREAIGSEICPTELRLVGHVETRRAFRGQAIFIGPHFLSPIKRLDLQAAGDRSFTGVYRLNWDTRGAVAAAGRHGPKRQTVTLKLNIASDENKVLDSAEETVTVTCEPGRGEPPRRG